jgi:hypothetical protein
MLHNNVNPENSSLNNTPNRRICTQAEEQILIYIESCGAQDLWHSLQFVHDSTLYYSEVILQQSERLDLLHVRDFMVILDELIREERGEI